MTRIGVVLIPMAGLASCAAPPKPAPVPLPPHPPISALPAAAPTQDWRDVLLTPGAWTWRGATGQTSVARFGAAGRPVLFALRCDFGTRSVIFSRAGGLVAPATMGFTTSFGIFDVPASHGGGQPPAIVGAIGTRDPRLDQIAFSRGRFLVDVVGQPRLVLPAWPEVARVIEDCRF